MRLELRHQGSQERAASVEKHGFCICFGGGETVELSGQTDGLWAWGGRF